MVERDRLKEQLMAIEIKGLGANVDAARAAIRRGREAMARAVTSGAALEQTANDIADEFEKHASDLLFEATSLGNGSGEFSAGSTITSIAATVAKPNPPDGVRLNPDAKPTPNGQDQNGVIVNKG
jgi:hypothetical protein